MMKSNKNTTPVTSVLSLITSIRIAHHFLLRFLHYNRRGGNKWC